MNRTINEIIDKSTMGLDDAIEWLKAGATLEAQGIGIDTISERIITNRPIDNAIDFYRMRRGGARNERLQPFN